MALNQCARTGCTKMARGDEFCSRVCCERANDVRDIQAEKRERDNRRRRIRNLEKKIGGGITIQNPDASAHVANGTMVFGKKRLPNSKAEL